jgi:NO-binding membrane sensor protein with MHYT domain
VTYYNTHHIPLHPIPGVLVTSIVVSILGSYATLLVLGRRTSSRGWRNHALLALAATCFASVAVWGMHFVSMISVRLKASPDVTWYLQVSPLVKAKLMSQFSRGFTTLSLFVPLIATVFAFWFIGSEADFVAWRVVVSGVFVGLTSEL